MLNKTHKPLRTSSGRKMKRVTYDDFRPSFLTERVLWSVLVGFLIYSFFFQVDMLHVNMSPFFYVSAFLIVCFFGKHFYTVFIKMWHQKVENPEEILEMCFIIPLLLVFSIFFFSVIILFPPHQFVHQIAARNQPIEVFDCEVLEFTDVNKAGTIKFMFQGEKEDVRCSRRLVRSYKNVNIKGLKIKIKVQKSLGNVYIVKDWDLE